MINFRKRKENVEIEPEVGPVELELPVKEPEFSEDAADEIAEESAESVIEEIAEGIEEEKNVDETEEIDPFGIFVTEARAYAQGKSINEDRLQEALDFITNLRDMETKESPTLEILETVLNGLDYQRAVAEARITGELEGRNKQIEAEYMRPELTDGLPHLGKGGSATKKNRSVASIFDLAKSAM